MQLKFTKTCAVAGTGSFQAGEVHTMPDDIAQHLIEIGNADPADAETPAETPAE